MNSEIKEKIFCRNEDVIFRIFYLEINRSYFRQIVDLVGNGTIRGINAQTFAIESIHPDYLTEMI